MSLSWNWTLTRRRNDRRPFNSGLKRCEIRLRERVRASGNSSSSIKRRLPATRSLHYRMNNGRSRSDVNTTVVTVMVPEFPGLTSQVVTSASSSS